MNKHKKTVVIFFRNTKDNFAEAVDHCKDSLKSIVKGLFGLFMVFMSILSWLLGLAILVFLPLATWLRLYIERKTSDSIERQRLETLNRSQRVSYKDE